jgi:hypothetical protein
MCPDHLLLPEALLLHREVCLALSQQVRGWLPGLWVLDLGLQGRVVPLVAGTQRGAGLTCWAHSPAASNAIHPLRAKFDMKSQRPNQQGEGLSHTRSDSGIVR